MKAMILGILCICLTGCELPDIEWPDTKPDTPPSPLPTTTTTTIPPQAEWPPVLGKNPWCPESPAGTRNEEFYFNWKDADNLFKVSWPAYLERKYKVGRGWTVKVNGVDGWFRSRDSLTGKPAFNCEGPKDRFSGEVICVLYKPDATEFAWFKIPSATRTLGRLPNMKGE